MLFCLFNMNLDRLFRDVLLFFRFIFVNAKCFKLRHRRNDRRLWRGKDFITFINGPRPILIITNVNIVSLQLLKTNTHINKATLTAEIQQNSSQNSRLPISKSVAGCCLDLCPPGLYVGFWLLRLVLCVEYCCRGGNSPGHREFETKPFRKCYEKTDRNNRWLTDMTNREKSLQKIKCGGIIQHL